nr:hypothetical protein [Tanacetum cinerariifolium]
MRTKPGVDTLNFDDLYNNLRVFESDVKGSNGSSSSTQNVAFVSSDNTRCTNEVNTAYGVSTSSGHNSQKEGFSSYTDDLMYSFFANQSSGPQLDHEDLEQVDEFDLEEMDLKWYVAMISTRLKKFYKKTRKKLHFDAKEPVGFDKRKVKYKARDNEKRPAKQDEHKAMVTIDKEGVDWTGHAEYDTEDFALMVFNSNNSGSDTEVISYSKVCEESYAKLKKLYDEQREQLGDASIEIQAYTLALKKMRAKDKSGLGYGSQIHDRVLSYENEVFESVFDSSSSDVEDSHVNDRFAKVEGMHAVLPPMTKNYMPPKSDFRIDDSSKETLETVPKPVESNLKVINEPKVWSNALIIEEYESDSDDEHVTIPSKEQEKPSFTFVNTVKHVKNSKQTTKEQDTCSQNSKPSKRDWNGLLSKKLGLGYEYIKKACFVELNKQKGKSTGPRENRPMWNNVQRFNHQNKFVPTAVLTKTGRFPVNAARQKFSSQAASTSTARKVNTARPIVNEIRPRHNVYKYHSPIRRPFNRITEPKTNFAQHKVNTARDKSVSAVRGKWETAVKASAGNKTNLVDYQDFNGGPVAFGGSKRQITGKGKIKTRKLDFVDVYLVKEVQHFYLFFVSQMCDKKNKVLFTDTECLVLSPDFKLPDENQVLLRVPRQHNMHSFNLKNIVPSGGLACFIVKDTDDESTKWHRSTAVNKANKTAGPKETNNSARTQDSFDAGNSKIEANLAQEYYVLLLWSSYTSTVKSSKAKNIDKKLNGDTDSKKNEEPEGIIISQSHKRRNGRIDARRIKREYSNAKTPQQNGVAKRKNRTLIEAARTMLADSFLPNTFWAEVVSTACYVLNRVLVTKPHNKTPYELLTGKIPIIRYIRPFRCHVTILNTIDHLGKFEEKSDEGFLVGATKARSTNYVNTSSTPVNTVGTTVTTASPLRNDIYEVPNDEIFTSAYYDDEGTMDNFINLESNVNEELLQFKTQQAWILVDLPFGKKVIGTKWVYKNKKDERGVVVRNKVRLVAQGHRQEEGIDYNEVFAPVSRLEAIRIFLAFASYMGFKVYQMDVKSSFSYGKIDEDVYLSQPLGFTDPKYLKKVYKVVKALYSLHQAPRTWILKKFDFISVKTASTPIKTKKPLVKDIEAADVDVHLYRSMIGFLMYLTASRPDIMYAVFACSRFQVTPKTSHLQAMKRIFRYLKGQPKLGLWYPRESAFNLEAYSDSDYAGANRDRKSTTEGCQFLSRRLIT